MSRTSAQTPFRILREKIRGHQDSQTNNLYVLYRAIVEDVDTVGGKFNSGKSPQNSLKVKIIKPLIDSNNIGETILWPLLDHISNPIFPTEEVLCIFETDSFDFGYWVDRIANIDKSFVPATSTITDTQLNDASAAFGVVRTEQKLTIDDLSNSTTSNNQEQNINKYNKYQKNFKFNKRLQDTVFSCKNTSRIVIGSDRRDSVDSGYDDAEAIDCVVGVQKENGDPDFENDKSRTYLSSKSNPIDDLGNQDGEALWYIKSDNDALIARKDLLIQSKDGKTKIKFNRDGNIEIDGNTKVTVKATEIICDGKTTIGGTVGNKVLTLTPGSTIQVDPEVISTVSALAGASTVPALGGQVAQIGQLLMRLIAAITTTTNSDAF